MKIKTQSKLKASKGLFVIPVFEEDLKKLPDRYPTVVKNFLKERVKEKDFEAKKKQTLETYLNSKELPAKMLLIGCAKRAKCDAAFVRELGGKVGRAAAKAKELTILLGDEEYVEEFLEGILMTQYRFDQFRSKKKSESKLEQINLVLDKKSKAYEAAVEKATLIVHSVNFVKDLVNSPANFISPEYMAAQAKRIAKENRYKFTVLGNKDLKKMGAGGILAVNNGSDHEANLIVLQYDGGARKEKPIVIVGKGVLFDTGGYNLKPSGGIETMHQDMSGAASVLGVFEVLKKLNIKRNVVGICPVVANMINEKAYRPSDILTMLNGKTVEITNTDAEGRLILADALTYATKLSPESIITVATLTGAAAVALGDRYCAILGNNKELTDNLQKAGDEVDELAWPLPIHEDYRKKMDSDIADYKNYDLGSGRFGGTAKAAAF
ncbi:leucyl aminopeptidase, partial [Candidatus Peregrinibacteria bacterium]|nr:leucyl aminopeptidase [Candidatus Peregrinibacteria bacterium]